MKENLSLIVITDENKSPIEFHLNKKKLKIYSITFIIIFISLFIFSIYQLFLYNDYQTLKKQNLLLQNQILTLNDKLNVVEQNYNHIIETEKKLRLMAGLYDIPQEVRELGHGGTSIKEYNYLSIFNNNIKDEIINASEKVNLLLRVSKLEKISYEEITNKLDDIKDKINYTPSIKPTKGWYSSLFGKRIHPFTGKIEFHKGLDIAAPEGTPIIAPADGRVIFVGKNGSYGNEIVIMHKNFYKTIYGHLSRFNVKKGQKVKRYDIIGFVGNTGRSTAPHLHYEIRIKKNNKYIPINPLKFIFD